MVDERVDGRRRGEHVVGDLARDFIRERVALAGDGDGVEERGEVRVGGREGGYGRGAERVEVGANAPRPVGQVDGVGHES